MGLLDEHSASWLLSALRLAPCAEKGDRRDHSFDIADIMEKGLSREVKTDFMVPLPRAPRLWKFHVICSKDKREHRLYCQDGEFLMMGRTSSCGRQVDIFLYDSRDAENATLVDPSRPAFTLRSNPSKTEWHLFEEGVDSGRCMPEPLAGGRQRREILLVRHSNTMVGDGNNHCMEVYIPQDGYCEEQSLVSKKPVWNDDVESLVLDFKSRRVSPSAKNFQLTIDRSRSVVCQHGKIGENMYALDFRYPMTVAQAFAVSLTATSWA